MVNFWSSRICRLLQLLMVIAYLTFAVSIRSLMSLVPILPSFFHLIVLIIFLISLRRAFHWSSLFPSTSCMFPRCLMCSPCLVHLMVSGVSLTMSKSFAALFHLFICILFSATSSVPSPVHSRDFPGSFLYTFYVSSCYFMDRGRTPYGSVVRI